MPKSDPAPPPAIPTRLRDLGGAKASDRRAFAIAIVLALVFAIGTLWIARNIMEERIADVAIDLYALASVLSRTTRAIEQKGESGAQRELNLTNAFAILAKGRLDDRLGNMERDSDELLKAIAGQTYEDGGYPFDIV